MTTPAAVKQTSENPAAPAEEPKIEGFRGPRDTTPARIARQAQDLSRVGSPIPVTDLEALRVLERGFCHVMTNNMAPHLLRIARETARAFPDPGEEVGDGWVYFLATAFDPQGRGAYLLRAVRVEGAADWAAARRIAEGQILPELRERLDGG